MMPHYEYADEYAFRVNLNKLLFEQMESVQNKPMNWHLKCWRQYLKTVHNIDVPLEATAILETICKHTKAKEMFEHLKGIKQLIIKDRQLIQDESESDESDESDVENDDIESDDDETSDDDDDDEDKESTDDEDKEETTDDEEDEDETDDEGESDQSDSMED